MAAFISDFFYKYILYQNYCFSIRTFKTMRRLGQ